MFYSLHDLAPQDVHPGYRARIYHGDQITFAVLEIAPEAALPAHRHENEQVGMVVRGALTLRIDGSRKTVRSGEGWVIPSNAEHDAQGGTEGAIVVETWAPPRHDFRDLPSQPTISPAWPPRSAPTIARVWRAWAEAANIDRYLEHFTTNVMPKLRGVCGFCGVRVMTEQNAGEAEITVTTFWSSHADVERFAGTDITAAVVDPEAARVLHRYEDRVRHLHVAFASD